ncbi:MAG: hypothetical protein Q4Q07_03805 [Tissierellia bacterium]|nr:hypothetical protein [Tissierellia bacterium]
MEVLSIILALLLLFLPLSSMVQECIPIQNIVMAQERIHGETIKVMGVIGTSNSLPKVLYITIPILLISLLLIFVNRKM